MNQARAEARAFKGKIVVSGTSELLVGMTIALVRDGAPEASVDSGPRLDDRSLNGVVVEAVGASRWVYIAPCADPTPDVARALAQGACAVLTLSSSTADWVFSLGAVVSEDQVYVAPEVLRWMASEALSKKGVSNVEARLTGREREVLSLVAAGASNSEIASSLGIAVNTVRTHLHTLSVKLETSSRTSMLANAQALSLIDIDDDSPDTKLATA